ncbi:unnamed protein product [Lactuca saligna]|uniref:Uncharacterized protein n=1 Tax=Lactuca saligna TaxID=75948 RepID=A0AA35ZMC4_LACSI|nr:unnamed protein product [Lactuca saligna]
MKRKRVDKSVIDKKGKVKGKKVIGAEGTCKEGKVGTEFQRLSTHMSPNSLYLAMKSLSKSQREMVRDMGFGSFLGMKIDTLPGKLAYFVVDSFTTGSCSIRVRSGEVAITNETVQAMFGLSNKGLDFNTLDECDKNDPLLEAWKGQYGKGNYYNGNYLKNIRKTNIADELFKLNFLTLFINTFAETETMGSCRINFIEKLIQCKDVSRINWCDYIVDCLGKSKNKWRPNDKNCYFTGPVALLMMAYADRVICEDVNFCRHRPFITKMIRNTLEC